MRRRKYLYIGVVVAVLLLLGICQFCQFCQGTGTWQQPARYLSPGRTGKTDIASGIDTVPMLIMQVQQCSKLYTAEYRVHKIITHDDALRFKGQLLSKSFNVKVPLADRKIAIPMDAKIKAC